MSTTSPVGVTEPQCLSTVRRVSPQAGHGFVRSWITSRQLEQILTGSFSLVDTGAKLTRKRCQYTRAVSTFDDRELVTSSLTAGLSLTLTGKAPESFVLGVGSEEVDIKDGSDALVVRMESASSYEDALNRGVDIAQRGLDLLAVSRAISLAVERTHTKHVAWWTSNGNLTVRCVIFFGLTFDARPATVMVRDASGRVVPPRAVPLVWHPSLRFFRLSQITGDLIDAYRNMFLALESILSDLRPQRPNEGEGIWLRAAFNDAHALYDLSQVFHCKEQ
jgi:hypothetical protein